jgi:hypothetical protein
MSRPLYTARKLAEATRSAYGEVEYLLEIVESGAYHDGSLGYRVALQSTLNMLNNGDIDKALAEVVAEDECTARGGDND